MAGPGKRGRASIFDSISPSPTKKKRSLPVRTSTRFNNPIESESEDEVPAVAPSATVSHASNRSSVLPPQSLGGQLDPPICLNCAIQIDRGDDCDIGDKGAGGVCSSCEIAQQGCRPVPNYLQGDLQSLRVLLSHAAPGSMTLKHGQGLFKELKPKLTQARTEFSKQNKKTGFLESDSISPPDRVLHDILNSLTGLVGDIRKGQDTLVAVIQECNQSIRDVNDTLRRMNRIESPPLHEDEEDELQHTLRTSNADAQGGSVEVDMGGDDVGA